MDYKKKIITLLDKVKTEQTFKQVYKLLEYGGIGWITRKKLFRCFRK
jgi:hypothetical protein